MKVAFCLSGQARGIHKCWESFKKHIIDPTKCDVFISFANDSSLANLYNIPDLDYTEIELIKDPTLEYLYSITKGDMPYLTHLGKETHPYSQEVSNLAVLRQLYFVKRANEMKSEYERKFGFIYDWVIRSRADVILDGGLSDLSKLDPKHIYTPDSNTHGGLNDFFAYGSSKNIDVYCDRINIIKEKKYCAPLFPFFNPHQELGYILTDKGISVMKVPLPIKRERSWRGQRGNVIFKYYGKYGESEAHRRLNQK